MPGYYLHLAACTQQVRENRSFVIGVEAPDILKEYFKVYGLDGAREKYNTLKTVEMPDFEVFESRIQQNEMYGSRDGLHYGVSSRPDVLYLWSHLSEDEKKNPFWTGYIWHLLTDLIIYTRLDIDAKFESFNQKHANDKDLVNIQKGEVKKLHSDWDRTNAKVRDTYPDVQLTPEVEELGVVQFINEGKLQYVDWELLRATIDYLRCFNPLQENFDAIIYDVINSI